MKNLNINFNSQLKELADPNQVGISLDINNIDSKQLFKFLEDMLTIRYAEEAIAELVLQNQANGPCHLGVGQEAIAVGISHNLKSSDRVFGAHRSHSHYLALGGNLFELFAEILGKAQGCSGGRGGSMHITAPEKGFAGSVPIVAGTIPLAVGAALAAKMDKSNDIAVAYFGDGASEEGSLHESLNLAMVYNLPVLFVCENNLYSSHLDIKLRQPSDKIARFAAAHCMHNVTVDGNDITKVFKQSAQLSDYIRSGNGPAFLELVTYRWLGHVGADPNIDVGVRRRQQDLDNWKQRDPISMLASEMEKNNLLSKNEFLDLQQNIRFTINDAMLKAKSAATPAKDSLLNHVYS